MDSLAVFNEHRALLFSIAYRMAGTVMDAEDLVQETWLRWQTVPIETVQSPKAYLTSVVTRLAIDHLRSARVKREVYVGQWLPEPLLDERAAPGGNAELADSLSTAFLVLLESLSPPERAVFLLKEVFGYDYAEVAPLVGKTEANCRQLVKRAKERLAAGRARFHAEPEIHARLVQHFFDAVNHGNLDELVSVLSEEAVLYADHGGKALSARRPIYGPDKIARFFLGLRKRFTGAPIQLRLTNVNGRLGVVTYFDGAPYNVLTAHVEDGRIATLYIVNNPDKLQAIPPLPENPGHSTMPAS